MEVKIKAQRAKKAKRYRLLQDLLSGASKTICKFSFDHIDLI